MAKNGGGYPSTRWKVNFMVCIWTIHPISMMNGHNKSRKQISLKKGSSKRTRGSGNSNINSLNVKSLTLSFQMQSEFCTDCGMFPLEIKMIGIYNQSNYRERMSHSQADVHRLFIISFVYQCCSSYACPKNHQA